MCGRFSLGLDMADLQTTFSDYVFPDNLKPRYNIAPTQPVAVIPNDSMLMVNFYRWGLIPSWAKDPTIGARLINARAETLAEKPAFRSAYRHRRCLVLADGFFEWQSHADHTRKTPIYIHMATKEAFAFAGLWDLWGAGDTLVLSCTIITTAPNELVAQYHDRMPVILPRAAYAQWLNPHEQAPGMLDGLLKPYPAAEMSAYPVGAWVNNAHNDVLECVLPVNAG